MDKELRCDDFSPVSVYVEDKMPECLYCAEAFENESDLTFHLYRDHPRDELGRIDTKRVKRSFESFIQNDISTVEQYLETEPTQKTIVAAIETFERVLRKTLEWENLDHVYDRYLEGGMFLVDALDTVVQTSGREILLDLIDQYDPRGESAVTPGIGAIIGNIVGRDVIRTRIEEGTEAIPAAELEYLETLVEYEHPDETPSDRRFKDDRWAVSHASGWGIGHPTYDVAGYILETARDKHKSEWSEQTLKQAFFADPEAATDTLERILADEQTHGKRFFVLSLKDVTWGVGIHTPGWDWRAEFDVDVELQNDVVERLRSLVEEYDLSDEVTEDWPHSTAKDDRP